MATEADASAKAAVVIATLGDSITAGTPGWDPDPNVRAARAAHDTESQWQYWAALRHPGIELRNHGISGQRTDEIARRLSAAARGAHALVLQGGINDIVQGRPVDDAARSFATTLEHALRLGLVVAVAEVLPWNNGWPDGDQRVRALNAAVRQAAHEFDVPVLPFYDTLEDPARPGRMREEWTSDGNHPSVDGYRRLGELALSPPQARSWWTAVALDSSSV